MDSNDRAYVVTFTDLNTIGQDFCARLGAMSALVVPALLSAVVPRNPRRRVLFLALAIIGLVEQDEEEQEHAAQRPLLRLRDGRTFASPIPFLSFRPERNSYDRYAVVRRRGRDPRKTAGRHLYHLMRSPLTLPATCLARTLATPPLLLLRFEYERGFRRRRLRRRRRRRTAAHGDGG